MVLDFSKIESLNIGGRQLISLKRKSDRKVIWQKAMEKLIKLLASNNQWQNYNYREIKKTQGDTGTLNYRNLSGNCNVIEPFQSNEFLSSNVNISSNAITNVIELDISDPSISAIGNYSFINCSKLSVASLSSVKYIGKQAFQNDAILETLFCPELTGTGDMAFENCGLTSLHLPKLVYAQNKAFRGISTLKEFDAPNLTGTNSYSIYSNQNLTSINIPSIKYVGGSTFNYDRTLSDINLHEVETLPQSVFSNCWALTCVSISDDNENFYLFTDNGELSNVGCILFDVKNKRALWCSELLHPTDIIIPNDITAIGNQAFYRATNISTISMPSIKYIGGDAFRYSNSTKLYDFSQMSDDIIPDLANHTAFDYQYSLYQIKVPLSLYYDWIEETNWCLSSIQPHIAANFTEVVGSDDNTYKFTHMDISQGRGSMDGTVSFIHYNSAGNTIYEPFANVSALSSISSIQAFSTVDPNISVIGTHSFADCTNLISVNVPYVTSLNGVTFDECKKLETVNCSSVTTIGVLTFNDCTAITSLYVPNLTSIENFTMQRCTNMSSLECSNVIQIKRQSLQQCTSLSTLYLPNLTAIGDSSFYLDTNLISVYTPNLSVLGTYSFSGCTNLTSINVSAVTNIPDYCFFSCKNIPSINALNLSSIGKDAFFQCNALTSINLDNVLSIGVQGFNYCQSITGVVDLPMIESLGQEAFGGCSHVTEFDLHNVNIIGNLAFQNCKRAEVFDFSDRTADTIPTLQGINAFNNCGSSGSSGTYQIKVPSSMYDDWISETNWSDPTIVSNIIAI